MHKLYFRTIQLPKIIVPSKLCLLISITTIIIFTILSLISYVANCNNHRGLSHKHAGKHGSWRHQLETSFYDKYYQQTPRDYDDSQDSTDSIAKSTPIIFNDLLSDQKRLRRQVLNDNPNLVFQEEQEVRSGDQILPTKILPKHIYIEKNSNLFSPIFNFQLTSNTVDTQHNVAQNIKQPGPQNDPNNLFDLVEPGSGAGFDQQPFSEPSGPESTMNMVNPTRVMNSNDYPLSTPTMVNGYDRPPLLNRRIPKLIAVAGQFWRYTLPADTFVDEDGDMRQLKTIVSLGAPLGNRGLNKDIIVRKDQPDEQYFYWLQYDQTTQTLNGFPTENDGGKHEFILTVVDRWGLSSNESIEINVRQHPSIRAFTHLISINRIAWDKQSSLSIVDVLGNIVRRLSLEVFGDRTAENIIIHSYQISQAQTAPQLPNMISESGDYLLTLTWSNSSMPIHHCDLGRLETASKFMIDLQYLNPDWNLEVGERVNLTPSQRLLKALLPEFRPSSIDISLQGSCESKVTTYNNNSAKSGSVNQSEPSVRMKIGKLNWKLGEPIVYRIPDGVFETTSSDKTWTLTLHTIDGLPLEQDPRYNFMEFNPDLRTLYGLPYDISNHVGQRELILTAIDLSTGHKVREVFVIEIGLQDLTTQNNRAFRVSLYFIPRANRFGPEERVSLSGRIIEALGLNNWNFARDQDYSDFVVMNIYKFVAPNEPYTITPNANGGINRWRYLDRVIQVIDEIPGTNAISNDLSPVDVQGKQSDYLYKFTWTNETIGNRGDCPVEVIKDNILNALERTMIDYVPPLIDTRPEDPANNDSVRFYERLKSYFEPESDLVHLRFEPLSACVEALEVHDVGNIDIADMADRATESAPDIPTTTSITSNIQPSRESPKKATIDEDEYWSIVVLIVLVVALIFVVMMFFMGMHTYRINQEKKFELQVRLAQARQNSMFLSSMVLADNAAPHEIVGQMVTPAINKQIYTAQDDHSSRKPVILDNEKQLWANGVINSAVYRPTAVHMSGGDIQTTSLRPNMTFTLDSIAGSVQNVQINGLGDFNDGRQRAMTLNRKPFNANNSKLFNRQGSMQQINHSQSILTVASLAAPLNVIAHPLPLIYTPLPVVCESNAETPREV